VLNSSFEIKINVLLNGENIFLRLMITLHLKIVM